MDIDASVGVVYEPTPTKSRYTQARDTLGQIMINEDMIRCLKYCLTLLTNAHQQIDHKVTNIITHIQHLSHSLHTYMHPSFSTPHILAPPNPLTLLAQKGIVLPGQQSYLIAIKREIVDTLRTMVGLITKYAAACLSGDARGRVRGYIMSLPARWVIFHPISHERHPLTLLIRTCLVEVQVDVRHREHSLKKLMKHKKSLHSPTRAQI